MEALQKFTRRSRHKGRFFYTPDDQTQSNALRFWYHKEEERALCPMGLVYRRLTGRAFHPDAGIEIGVALGLTEESARRISKACHGFYVKDLSEALHHAAQVPVLTNLLQHPS